MSDFCRSCILRISALTLIAGDVGTIKPQPAISVTYCMVIVLERPLLLLLLLMVLFFCARWPADLN